MEYFDHFHLMWLFNITESNLPCFYFLFVTIVYSFLYYLSTYFWIKWLLKIDLL